MQQETYLTKDDYRVILAIDEDEDKPTAENISAAVVKVDWEPVEIPLDDDSDLYEEADDEEPETEDDEQEGDPELFGRLHLTFNVNRSTLGDLAKIRSASYLTVVLELQSWLRHTFQGVVEPVQPAFSLERGNKDTMTCTIVLRVYSVAFWQGEF
jgi:hypothetical protein